MDLEALELLLAPEFRLIFAEDPRAPRIVSREQWFATLPRMAFGECELRDVEEHCFGNREVLNMRARFHDWTFDGVTLPIEYLVTDVFVHRDGRRQVVSRVSDVVGETAPHF